MTGDQSAYRVSSSETVYDGRTVAVRVDEVSMPDGSHAEREVVVVADAVAVVALDGLRRVCLIAQYRHPLGERVLELPAGKRDVAGEAPLDTARRELGEEADLRTSRWRELGCFLNSVGWTTEKTQLFLAQDVVGGARGDFATSGEEADLEVRMVALSEALGMIDAGEITDAKTIVGLLLTSRVLAPGERERSSR